MCIRDSGEAAIYERHNLRNGQRAEGVEFDLHPLQAGEAGNCLLYTSDAADERSSVDLGGRRIIKKKK